MKTTLSIEEIFALDSTDWEQWWAEQNAQKKLRVENPWVLDLIKVLYPHPKGLSRSIVLHTVQRNRRQRGHPLPGEPEATIQSALQQHCVHSSVFKKRSAPPEDGLFHWPKGAGAGVWAIYPERAQAWLAARGIRI
jgi:hypothetical protein